MNQEPDYQFSGQTKFYRGKVRDVYTIGQDVLVMVASNRISAFEWLYHALFRGKDRC